MSDIKWESEVDEDDYFSGYRLKITGRRSDLFFQLPKWHRDFFYSLWQQLRVEKSLDQLANGGKRAVELFESAEYERTEGLHPIMEIRQISEMIFPLVMFDYERMRLEESLIFCIAYEDMKARGISWQNIDLGCSEYEFKNSMPYERRKIIAKYGHPSYT